MSASGNLQEQIASCEGVYRAADVARHFGVTRSWVLRVWAKDLDVTDLEPPNIESSRVTEDCILADLPILRSRGYSVEQMAVHFNVSEQTIRNITKRHGVSLRRAV